MRRKQETRTRQTTARKENRAENCLQNTPQPWAIREGEYNKLAPKTYRNNVSSTTYNSLIGTKYNNAQTNRINKALMEIKPNANKAINVKAELKLATLNLQGGANEGAADKSDEITDYMATKEIDVLCLQETKRPHNDVFRKNGYIFVFASSITKAESKINKSNFNSEITKAKTKRLPYKTKPQLAKATGRAKGKKRIKTSNITG